MKFEIEDAKNLATLSRLEFSDEELKNFLKDFDSILNQVSLIDNVDVSGVDLKSDDVLEIVEVRRDEVGNMLTQQQVLQNAPEKKDGAFLVPITVE